MKPSKKVMFSTVILLFSLLISTSAYADVGIPLLVVITPFMSLLFIPVVIIEGYILIKYLNISKMLAFKTATLSNLLSTFVGIPLTWAILSMPQVLTIIILYKNNYEGIFLKILDTSLYATWLGPSAPRWLLPISTTILFIPFFLISWFIELKITKKLIKSKDEFLIKKAVLVGNILSYLLLEVIVLLYLIWVIT